MTARPAAARPAASHTWDRQRQHDEQALPLVMAAFGRHGYAAYPSGIEHGDHALALALRGQSDRTSVMLRFRPDQTMVRPGVRTLLVEVKSDAGGHPNFAIEADSYRAALEWNAVYRHVAFAFVDLLAVTVRCCWADALPPPRTVRVPQRWDGEQQAARLAKELPRSQIVPVPYTGGSGTPYFLVAKDDAALLPIDAFVAALDTRQ